MGRGAVRLQHVARADHRPGRARLQEHRSTAPAGPSATASTSIARAARATSAQLRQAVAQRPTHPGRRDVERVQRGDATSQETVETGRQYIDLTRRYVDEFRRLRSTASVTADSSSSPRQQRARRRRGDHQDRAQCRWIERDCRHAVGIHGHRLDRRLGASPAHQAQVPAFGDRRVDAHPAFGGPGVFDGAGLVQANVGNAQVFEGEALAVVALVGDVLEPQQHIETRRTASGRPPRRPNSAPLEPVQPTP